MSSPAEIRFSARAAAFRRDEELESEYLVLAEESDGGGRTLEIQLGMYEDDQDRRTGLYGHCVVLDRGPVAYRCIDEWRLLASTLTIAFGRGGTEIFEAASASVDVPDAATDRVREALAHLIDGAPAPHEFTVVEAP